MAFNDLRDYIAKLEEYGEVQRIEREVDWNLEVGAIMQRAYELGLPAPFFEKIKGYPRSYRVFGGPVATYRRFALSLGLPAETGYNALMEAYIQRKKKLIKPRIVKDAPCKENICLGDKVNLFDFPAPMLHVGDGGRYLCTWSATITKDPDTDWVNWGMYRAMILSENSLGGIVFPFQHIGMHYGKSEARNQPLPFAISMGTEPMSSLVAGLKLPDGVSEVDVAGGLRGEPVDLVRCETVDLYVPATSEIVIEGEMLPKERALEGPFGEFTGYSVAERAEQPVFRVKAITYRNDPILIVCCPGVPLNDNQVLLSVTRGAEILDELRRHDIPVVGVHFYGESAVHFMVVSVKPPKQGRIAQRVANIVHGVSGVVPSYLVVVEDDVDPGNIHQVIHAMSTKCHPIRGIYQQRAARATALTPFLNVEERRYCLGAAVLFDCTWPVDWPPADIPIRASFDHIYPKELQEYVLKNWRSYGFKQG